MLKKIYAGAIYGISGQFGGLLLVVALTPVLLERFGAPWFALHSLLWLSITLLGVADLGIGRALINQLARDQGMRLANQKRRQRILTLAAIMVLVLCSILGAFLTLGAYCSAESIEKLAHGLVTSHGWYEWAVLGVSLLAAALMNALVLGMLQGVSDGRMYVAYTLSSVFLHQVTPIALIYVGYEPNDIWILAFCVFSRICLSVIYFVHIFPWPGVVVSLLRNINRRHVSSYVAEVFSEGLPQNIGNACGLAYGASERGIVALTGGTVALGLFSVPLQGAERIGVISNAFSINIQKVINATTAEARVEVLKGSLRLASLIWSAACGLLVYFSNEILMVWLRGSFSPNYVLVFSIFTIGYFYNSLSRVVINYLYGAGLTAAVAKVNAVVLIPYLIAFTVVCYVCYRQFGIETVAIGAAAVMALRFFLEFNYYCAVADVFSLATRLGWVTIPQFTACIIFTMDDWGSMGRMVDAFVSLVFVIQIVRAVQLLRSQIR
jgi:hypothetical protein